LIIEVVKGVLKSRALRADAGLVRAKTLDALEKEP
jgi:hypothetical protein